MRILFLSQFFQPEQCFKGLPFALELMRRGHEVQVLTGFPNYPQGKLYEGYRLRPYQREVMSGVNVLRVPLYPSHDRSAVRRSLNYLSFCASASGLGALLVPPADVIYAYHPPITTGLAAIFLKHLRNTPFVYDIQDLWPDALITTGMVHRPALLQTIKELCRQVYRSATRITVLSPGFKRALCERGVPAEKIEVVYNWCDEEALRPTEPDPELAAELGMVGRFNVVFAGNLGIAQGLDAVLDAARLLAARCPQVQFLFMGSGVETERLVAKARSRLQSNVRFISWRPPDEAAKVLSLADALLIHLKSDPLFDMWIPSKTQAFMAIGKPLIAAVKGETADLVRRAGAGVVCPPESAEALARAVENLVSMSPEQRGTIGERGRHFYQEELSLRAGTARFISIFEEAIGRRADGGR
jgi:glycosyltransferase involved in cell wall biosynthesis